MGICVRPTIGQREECIPARVCETGANPSETIARYAAFKGAGRLGRQVIGGATDVANRNENRACSSVAAGGIET
jgi:hypothetical protein